jgi:hypothetical protein
MPEITVPSGQKEDEMKETDKRTLYECAHARVKGDCIYCFKGYPFYFRSGNGHINIERLAKGKRLAFKVCQDCLDYDSMGLPVPPEERGWLKKKVAK